MFFTDVFRITFRWKDGVVQCLNEQGRNSDTRHEVFRRSLLVKLRRIPEAVERGGKVLVKVSPGSDFSKIPKVQHAWILLVFLHHFDFQVPEKPLAVDDVGGMVEDVSSRFDVGGGGKGNAGPHRLRPLPAMNAEVFHVDVATHAEAGEDNGFVVFRAQGVPDDFSDVADFTVMVHSLGAIDFTAARAAVPGEYVPLVFKKNPCHALHVVAVGAALQTVSEQQEAPVAAIEPVEIEEIAVGHFDAFPLVANGLHFAEQRRVNGFKMAIRHQPGTVVRRVVDDWHSFLLKIC